MELAGLRDKLYWRTTVSGTWHCFKRSEAGYVSLCHRVERSRSGGQSCARPPVLLRCPLCDSNEIVRREAEESMPESPNWREYAPSEYR